VNETTDSTSAEARIAELAAERARLWEEVQRLRAERREVEYHERLLRDIQGSLSWRITTPLRAGKTLAVKLRRRLRDED
jgi:hypothetical protein